MIRQHIKTTILTFLVLGFSLFTNAQVNDIDFTISKIIREYPGYKKKTKNIDFEKWARETAKANAFDTFRALSIIVNFFKDEHLRITVPGKLVISDSIACSKKKLEILKYLENKPLKPREGFFINDYANCIIALKEKPMQNGDLEAYVMESTNKDILPGSILAKMEKRDQKTYFTESRSPHSGSKRFITTHFRNDSVFTNAAESKWKRISNYHFNYLDSCMPKSDTVMGRQLNESTYLVTVPISLDENIARLKDLLKKDSSIIASCRNLIIDNRRNVGGKGAIARPFYPWTYTNPIVRVSSKIFVTESYIKQYLEEIEQMRMNESFAPEDDSFVVAWIGNLQANMGKFLEPFRDTIVLNQVRTNPQKVGLIIDYGVQSAGEIMTLNISKSSKVTTFGETTMGAIDYLDFYPTETPSKKYKLYLPTTQRVFEDGEEIDGRGISPQIQLDDSMSDWIAEVEKRLNTMN